MDEILKVSRLKKQFHGKTAVNKVSFSINRGEITAILGPNGAGKTTTILMLLGLLRPDAGEIKILGNDPRNPGVLKKIGVMLQEVSLMDSLKVRELIRLVQSYYRAPLSLNKLIALTGLTEEDLSKRTEKLSGGQKRKVNFALALAGNPDLLFFDEPTVGMDVSARKQFWDTVNGLIEKGKTVIFTTHYLQEADDFAHRILLFNNGDLVAQGTPKEIKNKISKPLLSFIPPAGVTIQQIRELPFVSDIHVENGRMYVFTDDIDHVLQKMYERGLFLKDVQVEKGRLEDAFEQLTVKDQKAE